MKNKKKEIDNRKFNHDTDNLIKALNLSKEELKEYEEIMNEIMFKGPDDERSSEVIEKIIDKMPKRLLAWDLYNAVNHVIELKEKYSVAVNVLEKVTGKKVVFQKVDDEGQVESDSKLIKMMGKGGEA